MKMTNEVSQNAIAFLMRTELKGAEAGKFLEVLQAVRASTLPSPQLDIEDAISEADGT